jgi:hypothetical protein
VESSWTKTWSSFKSPLRVVVGFLLRSRENKAQKCRELKRKLEDAQRLLAEGEAEIEREREETRKWRQEAQRLQSSLREIHRPAPLLPADPPLGRHGFGGRMVCLSVNLAKAVGFRGAHRVMRIFFDWLNVERSVPHHTTIRNWLLREGVAATREPLQPAEDWIWMADHSNQIGPEKALVVIAIRASQMPPPGKTLKHEDLRVLTVCPGLSWKREDVAEVYEKLAKQHGFPRAVLTDGAVELHEPVASLKNGRSDTISLQDFKHKAANFLKARLNNNPRFAELNTLTGRTRSAIQQTELAHLTPPSPKPKARFMNLQATLVWAAVSLWLLDHPEAKARRFVTAERLEEKLGWLRSFAGDLAVWREYQEVISRGVTFINEEGLSEGAARRLRTTLLANLTHHSSRELAEQLVQFVEAAEGQLKPKERLPLSTEILESTFSLYKQLERQHSKGGFTSLLAGFGGLLQKSTPQSIRRAFFTTTLDDVKQWVTENLGDTLTTKRRLTYRDFRQAIRRATISPATG